jgi:hypothetical protein
MDDSHIVLFADFDSGNMARYEKVSKVVAPNPPANGTSTTATTNAAGSSTTTTGNAAAESAPNANPAPQSTTSTLNQPKFDVEFNVWTKPDCHGTKVGPNGNR